MKYLKLIIFFNKKSKLIIATFHIILIILSIAFNDFGITSMYYSIYQRFINDNFFRENNLKCDKYDPI